MATPPKVELIKGFIEEVDSYIPSLISGLDVLKQSPGQIEVLEETHRLVHTINGASSMVGLDGLSHIAAQMEDYLDEIMAGNQRLTEASLITMRETIDLVQEYCSRYLNGGVAARSMLKEAVTAFRHIRGLSLAEDEPTYQALLASVPEHEGLSGLEDITSNNYNPGDDSNKGSAQFPALPDKVEGSELSIESDPENEDDPPNARAKTIAIHPAGKLSPDFSQELLDSFYEEAEEHLEDLGRSLIKLESQVKATVTLSPVLREEIRRIRRAVHTLKGAAAVIGFQKFSTFAHSLEDLLDWLYEESPRISPHIIKVLAESSDLMDRIINKPDVADSPAAQSLKKQYEAIAKSGHEPPNPADLQEVPATDSGPTMIPEKNIPVDAFTDEGKKSAASDESQPAKAFEVPDTRFTRSLKVDMARIDDLVNLAGETLIALSAFDRKMEIFTEAVNDLESSRSRLKKIARDLEVSYEVKALEQLKSIPEFALVNGEDAWQMEGFGEFDALELDRYSELNRIIRTLNESAVDISAIHTQMSHLYSDFDGHLTRQRVILGELQDKIMQVRMTPMSIITNKLRRTVREVSTNLKKQVNLVITGENIELDRVIWEKITDPLMHLLRNAIDHGVESQSLRQAEGKPDVATVTLDASREGNQVVIRIADDGAGLDFGAIRSVARRLKLSDKIDEMTEDDLAQIIFFPGFSTRRKISEVSGRGVGMDVVQENIQDLKGVIKVVSEKGQGAEFTIRIPLTLAAVTALLFSAGGHNYAIALNEINEIVRLNPDLVLGPYKDAIRLGDQILPLYHLTELLQIGLRNPQNDLSAIDFLALVMETESGRAALIIDKLVGQQDIVIKSLGSHLRHVKGISGATILGDGSVVPILNVEELLWSEFRTGQYTQNHDEMAEEKTLEILVVDDSVSIRKVVSRLLEEQGWQVQTAVDGMDAMEQLRECRPDLIVLDIEMPRVNGFEFLGALKNLAGCETIPVIMLTSRTTAKHREKAIALGAKGFVAKPFNNDDFVQLILKITNGDTV